MKSASPDSFQSPGQTINYEYQVTNTGNVTINSLAVEDFIVIDGTPITTACPAAPLAPTQATTCTASYEVRSADQAACVVKNEAQAKGEAPGGLVMSNKDSVSVWFSTGNDEPFGLTLAEKSAFAIIESLLASTAAAIEASVGGCSAMAGGYGVEVNAYSTGDGSGHIDGLFLDAMLDPTHVGSGGLVDGGVSVRGEIFTIDQVGAGIIGDVDIANHDAIIGYDKKGAIVWGESRLDVEGDRYGTKLIKDFWSAPPTPANGCKIGQINDEGLEAITKLDFPRAKWFQSSFYDREDGEQGRIDWVKTQIAPYGADLCKMTFGGDVDLQGHGFQLKRGTLLVEPQ